MKNRERNAKEINLPTKKDQVEEEVEEIGNEESAMSDSEQLIPTESQMVFDDDGNEADSTPPVPPKATKKNKKELTEEEKKQKEEKLKQLRAKLASKIETSRAQRKAPGSQAPGAPKSREQILEERKRKQELRKRKREAEPEPESESDSDSDSGSESDPEADTESPQDDSNVLFGNIVFNDGSRVTSDLTRLRSTSQKKSGKGPANKDIKAHLDKLEHKKQKLAQMSPEEQAKYKEKEQWQRMMSHAEGVKVKDDEKLLKKALKRKEKQKLKSEIEWKERKQVVKDTIAAKQKRREENLKARRENKGKKAKKAVKLKKFTGTVHKNKRAGFEGTAKSKRSKK
ncbi:hypothetical protein PGUG_01725 [Meyerozyma guilliermondii ATCC 6260]|uniref:Ribosomal RNA-processing protein 14/surfeit locus protein 6 C-terminal domain-containing protein n=1 Tax=Meyerozyma guilliermondii (strain ATCC 6260 / CBS 566 / DSM 6381 / JCM 1539 / NBRC 10279 / NRRL Y-324) TaxID=294746 RepID=A5DEM4_PICGU|nr:uncharacterized protein PGUG_01725 [Meyerozyma guilliermondii ATCC 6260]EDK37626.2 hypothetical protein PGUG_01725 [Meyerozyma guilliermondii ATCC 6260]